MNINSALKRAVLCIGLALGLWGPSAFAANTVVLYKHVYINASWQWLAVGFDINEALKPDTSTTCTGQSQFDYNYGAPGSPNYITPNQIANVGGAVNATTYYLPIALTNCRDVYGNLLYGDGLRHQDTEPWIYSVCNPGYYAYRDQYSTIHACAVDPSSAVPTNDSNEQGPPLNCAPCLIKWLQDAAPNSASPTSERGDPVNAANGNEMQIETDYVGGSANLLSLVRYYNSGYGFVDSTGFNGGWSHNFRYAALKADAAGSKVVLVRPDGNSWSFTFDSTAQKYIGPTHLQGTLTGTFVSGSLWTSTFTHMDGTKEQYNSTGQLTSLTYGQGGTLTFQYSGMTDGRLTSVADGRGHQISFTYGAMAGQFRIGKATLPDNQYISYSYDAYARLSSVTYPGNAVKTYGYANTDTLLNKLTSIVDENVSTFATITYDSLGRATSTKHGSNAELTTFVYGATSTSVTNSLGVKEVMSFASTVGRPQTQGITTTCDYGCAAGAGTDQFVYDNNGNASAVINKLGVKTCLAFDSTRNLPTKVVDNLAADADCAAALSSPPASSRVKTYQWHASFAEPTVVTGPLSKTSYTYDSAGRQLTQTEYETTDATGMLGASASTTGAARTTTWTYNSQGSVLTIKAPRTDVNATTTYAYDTNQNLTSVTSPAGLVTTFGNYDANGRPQLITAPNGLQTTLVYDVRGRTTSVSTGGATTTYGYDAVGQLTSSVLPSGVTLTFSYDDAHRLIATADSFGNRVDRTLDSEGNVLQETVTGNGSVLALSRQAAYDQLSRATSLMQAQ